jgi:hypothetical protein
MEGLCPLMTSASLAIQRVEPDHRHPWKAMEEIVKIAGEAQGSLVDDIQDSRGKSVIIEKSHGG